MERKVTWNDYTDHELKEIETLANEYRAFLDAGKTERECVTASIALAEKAGYADFAKAKKPLRAGDRVYFNNMGKALMLFNVGSEPLENGLNILGAHIDSPRLDVKQNPLYEDSGMAYMDTHYYGGVKKYQWVALPLSIHGVIAKKDGTVVNVVIGEDESDPVVSITDLLIHLGREQLDKKASKVIEGEDLDILVGSKPLKGEEKDAVQANVIKLIKEKYNVEEEDFLSAELEIVPAGKAREAGLDRSMIMAYGQDDRICAFTSLSAMLKEKTVARTSCCMLVDKEEIGSVGATGARSVYFENCVAELLEATSGFSELTLRRCMASSKMLSSDVSAAFDPLYPSVFEKKNCAFMGRGVVFNKYTGSGGKGGSNDANAEFLAYVRNKMDSNGVAFQTSELGRVDAGGGGTIAYVLALYGMEVVDCGVPVLNMHAPFEISGKGDIYEAERCYRAFIG